MTYLNRTALSGKKAFVTGAARGIGFCTAQLLAAAGARVVISDLERSSLNSATTKLSEQGYEVETLVLDIADADACEAAAKLTEANGPLDILIANAGIAWDDTAAEDISDDVWRRVLDVNLNGTFWTCRAFGRAMLERGHGSVVTTGSMSGLISNKPQRQAQYNASKAGVHQLTRSLAGEWADRGVRVNSVAPTYVNTPMSSITAEKKPEMYAVWLENTPQRRMVEPQEVAAAIVFLASPAASAITGAVLPVDAGYTVW